VGIEQGIHRVLAAVLLLFSCVLIVNGAAAFPGHDDEKWKKK